MSIHLLHRILRGAVGVLVACAAGIATAQPWPSAPVRIVVPFAAGGSTDAIARIVAARLGETLGQPALVENRPGAGGALGADAVAKAKPDGLTLLLATTSTHAILPTFNPALPYKVRDFASIGLVGSAPNLLAVGASSPIGGVADLIQAARARPGALSFASSGNGTITHLIGERFKAQAGIDVLHVPYKTGVQALADVSSGQVTFQFDSIVWTLPQVRAGKLKALAITSTARSPLAPELPTVAEAGLAGFEGVTWFALVAPAATPTEVVARLNRELRQLLASRDVAERFAAQGVEPATGGSPQELDRLIDGDTQRWAEVIRKAGVKAE